LITRPRVPTVIKRIIYIVEAILNIYNY